MRIFGKAKEVVQLVFRLAGGNTVTVDPGTQSNSPTVRVPANLPAGNTDLLLKNQAQITAADISPTAGILDTQLATISTAGKVSNSATTAVDTNTPNAIVTRDGLGNFAAGTITASLTGNVSGNVSGTAANITGIAAPANGGSGQSSLVSAYNAFADSISGTPTKGDLLVRGAAAALRLPVGVDGQILTLDSVQATGMKWTNPAGGTVPAAGLVYSTGVNIASIAFGGGNINKVFGYDAAGTAAEAKSLSVTSNAASLGPALVHSPGSVEVRIPEHASGVTGTLNAATQTIYGAKTFNVAPIVTPFTVPNGVVQTSGAGLLSSALLVDANVSGSAAIAGSKIQAANGITNAGVVSTGVQVFAGAKTFSSSVTLNARLGQGSYKDSWANAGLSTVTKYKHTQVDLIGIGTSTLITLTAVPELSRVFLTYGTTALYSDDGGTTWTNSGIAGSTMRGVVYALGKLYAAAGNNIVAYRDFGQVSAATYSITGYVPDHKFSYVGGSIQRFYYSRNNNLTYSQVGIPLVDSDVSGISTDRHDLAYAPALGKIVSVGYGGTSTSIYTSTNGTTFTAQTTPSGNYTGVAWSAALSLFVAVRNGGATDSVITSPDGIVWTQRTTPAQIGPAGVLWIASLGKFVVYGNPSADPTAAFMSSSDGITWTLVTLADTAEGSYKQLTAAAWDPISSSLLLTGSGGTPGPNLYRTAPITITGLLTD